VGLWEAQGACEGGRRPGTSSAAPQMQSSVLRSGHPCLVVPVRDQLGCAEAAGEAPAAAGPLPPAATACGRSGAPPSCCQTLNLVAGNVSGRVRQQGSCLHQVARPLPTHGTKELHGARPRRSAFPPGRRHACASLGHARASCHSPAGSAQPCYHIDLVHRPVLAPLSLKGCDPRRPQPAGRPCSPSADLHVPRCPLQRGERPHPPPAARRPATERRPAGRQRRRRRQHVEIGAQPAAGPGHGLDLLCPAVLRLHPGV
jgi:hypothetical protein